MKVEICLKNDTDGAVLENVTHVSYNDDMSELLIHHKHWTLSIKREDIEYFVIRNR